MVRPMDVYDDLVNDLQECDALIEKWVASNTNAMAFKVLKAANSLRNITPFGDDRLRFVEDQVAAAGASIVEMHDSVETLVLRIVRLRSERMALLNKVLLMLVDAAQRTGDIHPPNLPWVREKVYGLTGGKCAYCDGALECGGNDDMSFFVEHVVPRCAGGPDNLANYVPSCRPCNSSKNGSHVLEFIDRRFPGRRRPVALAVVPDPAPATPEAALALFVEAA